MAQQQKFVVHEVGKGPGYYSTAGPEWRKQGLEERFKPRYDSLGEAVDAAIALTLANKKAYTASEASPVKTQQDGYGYGHPSPESLLAATIERGQRTIYLSLLDGFILHSMLEHRAAAIDDLRSNAYNERIKETVRLDEDELRAYKRARARQEIIRQEVLACGRWAAIGALLMTALYLLKIPYLDASSAAWFAIFPLLGYMLWKVSQDHALIPEDFGDPDHPEAKKLEEAQLPADGVYG